MRGRGADSAAVSGASGSIGGAIIALKRAAGNVKQRISAALVRRRLLISAYL